MTIYSIILAVVFAIVSCGSPQEKAPKNPDENVNFSLNKDEISLPESCGAAIVPIEKDPITALGFDRMKLDKELETGMVGHIHAAVHEFGHYVLNYGPTLQALQLSMVAANKETTEQLKKLNRHDKVRVVGKLIANNSPVPHIMVEKLVVEAVYKSPATGHNEYAIDLDKLLEKDRMELLVKVHANVADGKALVIGYKDVILPVFMSAEHIAEASSLYRDDKIRIKIAVMKDPLHPERPAHLASDPSFKSAITLVDAMVNCNRKKVILKGTLVKFFKSPQISFDTYAVRQVDKNGIERTFTLFPDTTDENVDFMKVFFSVGDKAAKNWTDHEDKAVIGRNNMQNNRLQVTATGWINVVSKNQANPQIMLQSAEDITFKFTD